MPTNTDLSLRCDDKADDDCAPADGVDLRKPRSSGKVYKSGGAGDDGAPVNRAPQNPSSCPILIISVHLLVAEGFGVAQRHWRRAKFFPQVRLSFRFHTRSRLIVLGWVNDTDTKRACGSKTAAYRVLQLMLATGHPSDTWEELLEEAARPQCVWRASPIVCLELTRKWAGSERWASAGIGPCSRASRGDGLGRWRDCPCGARRASVKVLFLD